MHILSKIIPLPVIFAVAASPVPPPPPKPNPVQQYRSLVDKMPKAIVEYINPRPTLRKQIPEAYTYLQKTCPAMRRLDVSIPWNLASWMSNKISTEEWKSAPYSFRMNSFKAVAVQVNSDVKTDLLGKLYETIEFHPAFDIWIDKGKENFNRALHSDPYLMDAKKSWKWIVKKDSRLKKYAKHIGKLVTDSLIPGIPFDDPEITIHRLQNLGNHRGSYIPSQNRIELNISRNKPYSRTPEDLDSTIAHEYFHAIQIAIRNWYISGRLENDDALSDAGKKFLFSYNGDLAHIASDKNYHGYKNSFHERASFYFADAAGKKDSMTLNTREKAWIDKHLIANDKWPNEKGSLPKACALK